MRKLSLVFIILLASCGKLNELPTEPGAGDGGDPIDETATFTRVQNEVFTPTCAAIGCHDPLGQQQGLVLTSGRSYASTVGKQSTEVTSLQIVTPSDYANSYLYRKVTG